MSAHAPAVFARVDGQWQPMSVRDLLLASKRLSRALLRHGLAPGDRLAIVCRTRLEWLLADLAAMAAGVIVVGIDAHASDAQVEQILDDSGAVALLIDSAGRLARIPSRCVERMVLIACIERAQGEHSDGKLRFWDELVDASADDAATSVAPTPPPGDRSRAPSAEPYDSAGAPATLLYTSGTSGSPKGILYRQHHMAVACRSILTEFPTLTQAGGSMICWLPMAALFQRMMNYVALAVGVTIYFIEDPANVVAAAQEIEPTYFIGVPRFFEKLHQGIERQLEQEPAWVRRLVAFSLAHSRGASGLSHGTGASPLQRLLDALVLRKLRGILGRRLRFVITGSAPTPVWLLEYFDRLGVLVLEAYGLSENTVPIAANRPTSFRFGSVGRPFAANDVRIADDGEILVRGAGLFAGYDRSPQSTAGLFTDDGFYRTGDLGRFDEDGFLFISGRKSEVFKTSTGRRVSPARIEAVYKKIGYLEQIVVVGQGRPFPAALLSLDDKALAAVLRSHGVVAVGGDGATGLAMAPAARAQIESDFEAVGAELNGYERVRRFDVLPRPLTFEGGELTSSLKVKRHVVERKYEQQIDGLYR